MEGFRGMLVVWDESVAASLCKEGWQLVVML